MSRDVFGLQWMEHTTIFKQAIGSIRNKNLFTDATLACEGKFYPVHKFILSTCSEYFNAIFEYTPCVNPVIVINNIACVELESLLDFMYNGEASVIECQIDGVMKAAECLHIKGLALSSSGFPTKKSKATERSNSTNEPKKKRNKTESRRKLPNFAKPKTQRSNAHSSTVSDNSGKKSSSAPQKPSTVPLPQNRPQWSPLDQHLSSPSTSFPLLSSLVSSKASLPPISSVLQPSSKSKQRPLSPLPTQPHNNELQLKEELKSPAHFEDMNEYSAPIQYIDADFSARKENYNISGIPALIPMETSNITTYKYDPSVHPNTLVKEEPSLDVLEQPIADEDGVRDLSEYDRKIISQELHLDGPVKDLQIATENGTVTIPEILEGLVDMGKLCDSKDVDSDNFEKKTDRIEEDSNIIEPSVHSPAPTDDQPLGSLILTKEDTDENMYDFTDEYLDPPSFANRDKIMRTYGSSALKRKLPESLILDMEVPATVEDLALKTTTTNSDSSPSTSSSEIIIKTNSPFFCSFCRRSYKKKDSLTRHIRVTHSEFPYTCSVCSFKCKTYTDIVLHRKSHSNKHCAKCDFVTTKNELFRRHMLSHEEVFTHTCPYSDCNETFKKPGQLKNHVQKHQKKNNTDIRGKN